MFTDTFCSTSCPDIREVLQSYALCKQCVVVQFGPYKTDLFEESVGLKNLNLIEIE